MSKTKQLTVAGIFAALYVVLCIMLGNLSYMGVQVRLATLIEPLPFYFCRTKEEKRCSVFALMVGIIVANMFSPLGIIDVLFGIVEEALVIILLYNICKNSRLKQTIAYTLVNALLVALELYIVYRIPYVYSVLTVGVPAFILYFIGTYIMQKIMNIVYKL